MCTVTWLRRPGGGGFELFFNRDEMLTRAREEAPRVHERRGRRFIAPRDGDFGGSWLSLNEFGLAVGILNGYVAEDARARTFRSRGLLLTDLADALDAEDALARLRAEDLPRYRSFVLLALDPVRAALVAEWDGAVLHVDREAGARSPLISSAIRSAEVRAARAETFHHVTARHGGVSVPALRAYHASHRLGPSSSSPCMHRGDAETRSFSHLSVDAAGVRFAYAPGPPCRTETGPPVTLSLARPSTTSR